MNLSREQFERTQKLALSLAGISLLERHRALIGTRSRRAGICDEAAMDQLLSRAESGQTEAGRRFISLLTTKVTQFFRHPIHFRRAAECARNAVSRQGQARIWSAAAATGEEPWSLAFTMLQSFEQDNPPVTVLATDVDADALAVAQKGEYAPSAVPGSSLDGQERFVLTVDGGRWTVGLEARRLVKFQLLNLIDAIWPVAGPFDVIFCRNVLMYLGAAHRVSVLAKIAALLAPDGLLMLDPSEHLGAADSLYNRQAEGIYALRRSPGSSSVTPHTFTGSTI